MDQNMEITFPGNLKVDSTYKGFSLHTDQPKKEGGDGTAPEPFDLFLSSIGTCAGVYVLFFCQERHIDTQDIKLVLEFDRNQKTHMVEKIFIRILLPPSFPKKYEKAITRIAGMCTVKKHLQQPPEFDIIASAHP
jgi:ribosomal protein S12 methylthiotransferase accessory factor